MRYFTAGLVSIFVGFALSAASVILAVVSFPNWESFAAQILLWNYAVAGILAEKGWLAMCYGCEMMTIMFLLADGFFVGLIGYSLAFFLGQMIFLRMRANVRQ